MRRRSRRGRRQTIRSRRRVTARKMSRRIHRSGKLRIGYRM